MNKDCVNCKWSRGLWVGHKDEFANCKHPKNNYTYTAIQRNNETTVYENIGITLEYCGPTGKWFEYERPSFFKKLKMTGNYFLKFFLCVLTLPIILFILLVTL